MMHLTPRILVVDDDIDTCRNLADILEELSYHVDVAYTGRQALCQVIANTYDVAILDLKMPDMDGLTLYREIKKLRADTVAMIVTAYATAETTNDALKTGVCDVLRKPVDLESLLHRVNQYVKQPLMLIVDDDCELCQNLWDVFREFGCRVSLAHNQTEADARLSERNYQVVLVDMKLPEGDGRKVVQLVRESNPQARVVIITGYRSELEEFMQQVVIEGVDAVCYKPFDLPKLLGTVTQLAQHNK